MSLLLQALKQIDGKPATAAMPAEPVRPADLQEPPSINTPAAHRNPPIPSAAYASASFTGASFTSASAGASSDSLASRASPATSPSADVGCGGTAPTRHSTSDSVPRPAVARALAHVATDAQRQLADDVLAMLAGSRRLLALLAVDAPSDVWSTAGDLALGLAARQTGDVLLIGSGAGETRQIVASQLERSLAEIVNGQTNWAEAVIASGIERLSLLERGTWADGRTLTAQRPAEAWRALPRQFHHVVIDAGSVSDMSPSPLLSSCDAILLVVRLGATSQAQVDEAIARLRSTGLSPSGCLALACIDSRAAA